MIRILIVLFFVVASPTLMAQKQQKNNWEIFVIENTNQGIHRTDTAIELSGYYLVEIKPDQKAFLYGKQNLNIVRKLDDLHYIIHIPRKEDRDEFGAVFNNIQPANNQWKLSPPLLSNASIAHQDQLYTFTLKTTDLKKCKEFLNKHKSVSILKQHAGQSLIIQAPMNFVLDELIHLPEITYISRESHQPKEESLVLDLNLNVNKVNMLHSHEPDLNGTSINLSIKEERYDEADIDLKNRLLLSPLSAPGTSKHATEMATIAAGAGNTSPFSRGAAWGAQLSSSNFANLFPDPDVNFEEQNITIQNHAYGTILENFYGAYAEAYDEHINTNPKLIHVFSAGNNGTGIDSEGTYKDVEGFANLTGNFKMAKNIITVSAVDTLNKLDPFVSSGPAYDGRIKPEIAAYSTVGSSSSAALVSGISAILHQAYKNKNGETPESALIKGILMNTADDIGAKGIDFKAGYGSVNANRALAAIQKSLYSSGTVANGGLQTISIDVPANVKTLKVMLSWNDPAATANANTALINDLDLSVSEQVTGTNWLPWVLNSYPHADSLNQLPKRRSDHLNNAEQVTISNPDAGIYDINVVGYDIPQGPQKFYITYFWELNNSFTWTSPVANDNMPTDGKRISIFRWENTYENVLGVLEYSLDNGATWKMINSEVDLTNNYYSWTTPAVYAAALARMTIGSEAYVSESFVISRPMKVSVGFNCADSVMFLWNRVENAQSYVVYTVGDTYMTPLIEVSDSSVVLNKNEHSSVLYAVAPVINGGQSALRTLTFNYGFQGVGCYLSSFFALENRIEGNVQLSLTLGTTHQVSEINFEREKNGTFIPIATISEPTSSKIEILDDKPLQGLSKYRARISFANNIEIISDTSFVYFLTELTALIFPNPVHRSQSLSIFTKDFSGDTAYVTLTNSNGQVVLVEKLYSEREDVLISHLQPGLYLYTIISKGERYSGKVVVR